MPGLHSGKASVMVLECVEDKAKRGIVSGRRGKRVKGERKQGSWGDYGT